MDVGLYIECEGWEMNHEITIESGDRINIFVESIAQKTFILELGEIKLHFARKDLVELNEMIDSVLWDDSRDDLVRQIDEAEAERDRLQDIIDDAGAREENNWEG